ncbi:hypothetical protein CDAR_84611 [Caerostris darwini]|uniref:Uncharacterized protein n=1 Tax=Caerostris darwini TaxID=1538125 RepID=A0AAV4RM42_9ARAC|nr:hypothetical protein CDAR_84611 [Caerostris darwini]
MLWVAICTSYKAKRTNGIHIQLTNGIRIPLASQELEVSIQILRYINLVFFFSLLSFKTEKLVENNSSRQPKETETTSREIALLFLRNVCTRFHLWPLAPLFPPKSLCGAFIWVLPSTPAFLLGMFMFIHSPRMPRINLKIACVLRVKVTSHRNDDLFFRNSKLDFLRSVC